MNKRNTRGISRVAAIMMFLSLVLGSGNMVSAVTCGTAAGTIADLSSGGTVTINGAIYTTTDQQSTGSGVIQSFVRISTNDNCEQGYNTSGRPLQFDENNSPTFTHDLLLSAVPIVTISGVQYREFLLDINQNSSSPDNLLSLERLEIWEASEGSLLNFTPGTGFGSSTTDSLLYSLDGAGDRYVLLNYNLNSGSGSGDLFLYVPNSLFTGANVGPYIYLFSRFGDHNSNNDGFEEWAVRTPTTTTTQTTGKVPEPSALILLGIGLTLAPYAIRRLSRRDRMTK